MLERFWCENGAQEGAFWSKNPIKNWSFDFLKIIEVHRVFQWFWASGGSRVALKEVSFASWFLFFFLVRLGQHFRAILAPQMESSWSKNRTKKSWKKVMVLKSGQDEPKSGFGRVLGWLWGGLGRPREAFWRHLESKNHIFTEFSRLVAWFCSELCILAKDLLKSCCLLKFV